MEGGPDGSSVYSRIARICRTTKGRAGCIGSSPLSSRRASTALRPERRPSTLIISPLPYIRVRKGSSTERFLRGENDLHSSAVCSFSMNEVERAFDEDFLYQKSQTCLEGRARGS
ncbi:Semaphorin5Blike [Caligus rogercresseyi]|uniref:Semaphorin5Blike n=1 Tax=Caligus rogercresseyi TaxID=217165 RepID=A0A7T8KC30_CALRO|nr:Semaphorin5Blike [Caligus rogercresseyi]